MIARYRLLLPAFIAVLGFLASTADAKPGRAYRYPTLTPDGKQVVFCYRGDIWVAPTGGEGRAQRLTIHEEQDTLVRVSPDGKQVAFSSKRAGGYDIWVMPITGGEPKRVTWHSTPEVVCDWSPDGERILFMSNRDADEGRYDLYEASLKGGTPRRITFDGGRDGSYSADGKRVVYARGFNSIYWDDYEGSANYDLYVVPTEGGTPKQLTDTDGNERYPFFSKDGETVYFVAEEKAVANFYAMPAKGGERRQVTKFETNDVHRPDLAWDQKTVVFEIVGQLYTTDLEKADKGEPVDEPTPVKFELSSDVRSSGVVVRTITTGAEQVHIGPNARLAAFVLRGDIWVMPASGGSARRVTSGAPNDQWPRISPDGKKIAYFTNRRNNNNDIFVLDLKSGKSQPLVATNAEEFFHNWSPDGRSIVFCRQLNGNKDVWVRDLETGQERRLTRHAAADDDPAFLPDGSGIVFDSGREGSQAIYTMKLDGSGIRRITQGAANFQVPSPSPDGKMVVYEAFNPGSPASGGLFVSMLAGGPSMRISGDGSTACWSPRGDYIYFTADRSGGRPSPGSASQGGDIYRVKAPTSVVVGERVPFVGRVEVDKREELEQVFDEAWNALKNGFYDPKMHGVDWEKMKKKYRPLAIDAENKDEFANVVRQMLAELGASHLGIFGGERDLDKRPSVKDTGQLGADLEQAEQGRAVTEVLPGGPADQAGMRVGDVVTKIGGKKLKAGINLDRLLAGKAGQDIAVSFRPKSVAGLGVERTVRLKPISWGQLRQVRYKAWVERNDRRVKMQTRIKGGHAEYLHLNQMNAQNLRKFQQAIQRWNQNSRVDGLVLDVRNNGGGNIHQQLMQVLVNKPLARVFRRGGQSAVQPALYWDKPVVLLINERSFSDAEVFPYMFQKAGIGKVIGVPTAGGVIGTQNITLSDGTTLRIPRTGFKGLDGTNLEGLGVKPDIVVEETVEDRLQGRDPQLAKAIEVVKQEMIERRKEEEKKKAAAKAKKKKADKKKTEKKKADEEEPKPEPVKPTTLEAAKNPLADAVVGEWVRYRVTLPTAEESVVKVTVKTVESGVVELEQTLEKGSAMMPLPGRVRRVEVEKLLPMFGQVTSTADSKAKIGDVEHAVFQSRLRTPDGLDVTVLLTNAVPGYGLWKVEIDNQRVIEAIEWGAPAPEPTPAEEGDGDEAAEAGEAEAGDGGDEAGDGDVPDSPLYDAKVGEWVKFRHNTPQGTLFSTLRVTDVSDEKIEIEASFEIGGRTRTMKRSRKRHKKLRMRRADTVSYDRETITVAGEQFDCIVVSASRGDRNVRIWFCDDVPVDGRVREERNGTVVAELVEYGREG